MKKHQTTLSDEIERKIIRLFALGMSYQDISREIEELYAFSVSTATISAVTDKVIPELKLWQQRPLEKVYPFVWLDAIHYKIREDGRYQSKAVYTVLALNLEGKKEVLGLYLSESEGANFWLSVLSDLQNRGVEDILIACVDGLTGFPEAIKGFRVSRPASYPDGPLLRTGLAELPHPAPDRSVSPHIFSESVTILIWFSIYPDNPAFSGSDSAFSMSSDDDLLYG